MANFCVFRAKTWMDGWEKYIGKNDNNWITAKEALSSYIENNMNMKIWYKWNNKGEWNKNKTILGHRVVFCSIK